MIEILAHKRLRDILRPWQSPIYCKLILILSISLKSFLKSDSYSKLINTVNTFQFWSYCVAIFCIFSVIFEILSFFIDYSVIFAVALIDLLWCVSCSPYAQPAPFQLFPAGFLLQLTILNMCALLWHDSKFVCGPCDCFIDVYICTSLQCWIIFADGSQLYVSTWDIWSGATFGIFLKFRTHSFWALLLIPCDTPVGGLLNIPFYTLLIEFPVYLKDQWFKDQLLS